VSDGVLRWRVVDNEPGRTRLHLESPLLSATLTIELGESETVWSTDLTYLSRVARPVWFLVGPLHGLIVPYRLRRAAAARVG
jgi:hypothetical protein